MHLRALLTAVRRSAGLGVMGCSSPTEPTSFLEFVVDVDGERFVEVAVEVCDGRPSYVEANQSDFPTYCPSGARVVARR